jgi:hypothetical protein
MDQLSKEQMVAATAEDLQVHLYEVDAYIGKVSAYQQTVHDVLEAKLTTAAYLAKVSKMSPAERKALLQALAPSGIASSEEVSKP